MTGFRIQLHGRRPPNYEKALRWVYSELLMLYVNMDGRPERLITHTVMLRRGPHDGAPSVHCWGDPGSPGVFHIEYHPKTEWIKING